ncbi:MAG: DUF3412 domain-containing protein, partial [Kangiella sp.]|nr:DUF3412 domain-containing protein [Kangiella sp.]
SADYFTRIDQFISKTLGATAQAKYQIIIDDPVKVARSVQVGVREVREYRKKVQDAFHFNWQLHIDWDFQESFDPTHQNMASLNLHPEQPLHLLAANLRKAFSGIVAGNVKEKGIAEVKKHGPYQLDGNKDIMQELDELLEAFVEQKRMKLDYERYVPCYQLKK